MSAVEIPEIQGEIKPLIEGITKKLEPKSEIVESQLPEAPDTTAQIIKILDEKKASGLNLSDKDTYVRIFNEIAETVHCSYNNVKKVAKKHLNASNNIQKESVQADKTTIIIKKVGDDSRPPPKQPQEAPKQTVFTSQKESDEVSKAQIAFEAEMILLSFENVADFEKMILGRSPKIAKMKKMAVHIATYNHLMRSNGKPEQVIDMGEKLMKYMLYAGVAGMFLNELGATLKGKDDNSNKGIKQKSSMR